MPCSYYPKVDKKSKTLLLPYANTDMMNLFLDQVSKDFNQNEIIMQVDGAA